MGIRIVTGRRRVRLAALGLYAGLAAATACAADLTPLFQGALEYSMTGTGTTGASLFGVATGDFNGDGKQDVISVAFPTGLMIQLGNGDGTLRPTQTVGFGSFSRASQPAGDQALAVGDFNGDGRLDVALAASQLAASGTASHGVLVYLGNGDGTFQAPVEYATGDAASVAITDLNGDGKSDLLVTTFSNQTVAVLLGNGDGTFQAAVNYAVGQDAQDLAIGDFNGDGKRDVAVTSVLTGNVSILLGNGDGTLQTATSVFVTTPVATQSGSSGLGVIAAADFNRDGKQDLVISTFSAQSQGGVFLLTGNGDGTFAAPQTLFTRVESYSLVAADFDGDGMTDLMLGVVADGTLATGAGTRVALFYRGNGDGSFRPYQVLYGGEVMHNIAAADFNGDGRLDLVSGLNSQLRTQSVPVTWPATTLMLQPFPATYGTGQTVPSTNLPVAPVALAIGDFNNDGKVDIAAPVRGGTATYLNAGAGLFAGSYSSSGATSFGGVGSVAVADFNHDGNLDYAYGEGATSSAVAQIGSGTGTFTFGPVPNTGSNGVVTADFNGDGKPDLANLQNGAVQLILGAGDGTFPVPGSGSYYQQPTGNGGAALITADFNGDGKADVAVTADSNTKKIVILLGNGDGTLQTPVSTPAVAGRTVIRGAGLNAQALVTADFNGDGKLDLATLSDPTGFNDSNVLQLLLGNGDGTFQAPITLPAFPYGDAYLLYAADFDGDGTLDLVVMGAGRGDPMLLLRGNGDGTFRATEQYALAAPAFVAAGDFKGTGRVSLAIASNNDNNFTVLLNRTAALVNPVPTVRIGLSANSITVGASATLTWSSTNATGCTASGAWTGAQPTSGSVTLTPQATGTSTYTLSCSGPGGSASGAVVLTVNQTPPVPTVTLAATPASIVVGQSAALNWSSSNATACQASGAWTGAEPTSGMLSVTPGGTGTQTYTLACTGPGGSASASATLTVNATTPAPTVAIAVNPTSITVGQSAILTWSSTDATACTASGAWSGAEGTAGSLSLTPTDPGVVTYTLDCTGAGGLASASASLTVAAASPRVLSGRAGGGGGMGLLDLLWLCVPLLIRALARRPALGRLAARAAVVAAAMLIVPAQADEATFDLGHLYVGARGGSGTYQRTDSEVDASLTAAGQAGTTVAIDRHRFVGSIYAGVPLYRSLALEVGFVDLGRYPISVRANGGSDSQVANAVLGALRPAGRGGVLGLAASLPLGRWLELEPRASVLWSRSRQEVYTPSGTFARSVSNTGIAAGIALLARPSASLRVGGGMECFGVGLRCDVIAYTGQFEYHFGPR
jgi:hypothetical protein